MVTFSKLHHFFLSRFGVWPNPCHLRQVNGAMAIPVQIRRDNSRELLHFGLAKDFATISCLLSKATLGSNPRTQFSPRCRINAY
jgi:hypothetical protein